MELIVGDAAKFIRNASKSGKRPFDAIILDMYEGVGDANRNSDHPFYGHRALRTTKGALKKDGIFAAWTENEDRQYEQRLKKAGFHTEVIPAPKGASSVSPTVNSPYQTTLMPHFRRMCSGSSTRDLSNRLSHRKRRIDEWPGC